MSQSLMDGEEIRKHRENHHKRSINEVADTAWQQDKTRSNHNFATASFIPFSHPVAPIQRELNPAEQVKHAYQLEIRGWQKKYEAEKKKNDIGSRAWNDVHRDLEAGQSAHEAERIKVESSERKASQLSEQVEELRSALQAKETEHNSFQDASTIRANDLIQQLNNSEIRLQSREQEVFELNNQLAACRTTIATKDQELTEAGNKLSGTQRKLSESEEQHRECRQTLKLRTTELVKLNQILKETRRTVDATFDRELTKIGDRQTAQESQVTTLEGRVAKEIITKDKEIDELKKEIITKDKEIDELKKEIISKDKETDELKKEIITKDKRIGELKEEIITKDKEIGELKMETASWKDENTRLRDNPSQEDAKKMEAEGFIVDMHGLTQFYIDKKKLKLNQKDHETFTAASIN